MKREIKFRAYNSFSNKMHHISEAEDLWSFLRRVHGMEIMQYTGLKDKNGVEIYEGDILEGHSDGNGLVVWSDYDGGYDYQFKDGEIVGIWEVRKHCIVIGNIHQNPELL